MRNRAALPRCRILISYDLARAIRKTGGAMESLYRKYRPQTFDDVVGQKHVVATLRRAVLEGRTSHAYLFCGPRGTGKTTMARLLAKALLCEQGAGHLPDGTCEDCQLIASGEHPDVYELDAASNTGVDNVREEIINRVSYAPVRGDYKIYIIDEVHMLTPAAFNALLKTLEEPPEHVVFVMCTTDPQKVLETILSRVQRFDFRPISNDELLGRLIYVCEREGFSYDREALELVVLHARGGMRDALSDLERLATYTGGSITLDAAQDMLGEVPASTLSEVSLALASRDVPRLFAEVATLTESGRDLLQFTRELTAHLRDAYVVAAVGERPGVVSAQGDALARLGDEARSFGSVDRISRAMAVLGDASSEMRTAPNQRLVLELAFTRIARPESEVTLDALAERVAVLEAQLAKLAAGGVVATAPAAVTNVAPRREEPRRQAMPAPEAKPAEETRRQPTPVPREVPPTQAAPTPRQQAVAQGPAQRMQSQQAPTPTPAAAPTRQPMQRQQAAPAPQQPAPRQAPAAVTDPGDLQRRWRQVCDELLANMPSRGSLLMNSSIMSDDGQTLLVTLPKGSTFAAKMLDRTDVREAIAPAVNRAFGRRHINYVESSLKGADIARNERAAAATAASPSASMPRTAPQPASRPAPQQASRPAPQPAAMPQQAARPVAQPAVTQRPATVPAQAPQVSEPPKPRYAAPWDEPVYEEVPYSEADMTPYEEDEYYAPSPLPGEPVPQPRQVATPVRQPVPVQQPRPAAVVQPAPVQQPAPQPQPQPAPQPKAEPQPVPVSEPQPEPAPQPDTRPNVGPDATESAKIMAMLTDVFGPGVTMTTVSNATASKNDEVEA